MLQTNGKRNFLLINFIRLNIVVLFLNVSLYLTKVRARAGEKLKADISFFVYYFSEFH